MATKPAKTDVMQRLSPGQNCALGACAGVCSKLVNYPLLVWKNAVQQGRPISLNPSIVYRGLPMACMNLGGTTAVQFLFVGLFQRAMSGGDPSKLSSTQVLSATLLGGLCSGVPGSVWELTMIQQQNSGGSIVGVPTNILKEYGMAGLARGMTMCVGREGLFTLAMLGVTPALQRKFQTSLGMEENMALAGGALASAISAATLTHPMDTIKTCQQGDMPQAKFTSVTGTYRTIVAEHGMGGLFRGLGWRSGLIATTFFLVNKFKGTLAPVMFGDEEE